MTTYKDGDLYLVTIPPFEVEYREETKRFASVQYPSMTWLTEGDPAGLFARMGAKIKPIIPAEPAVGSVWLDGDGKAWQHRTTQIISSSDRPRWWSGDGQWIPWALLHAKGGYLIHDGSPR